MRHLHECQGEENCLTAEARSPIRRRHGVGRVEKIEGEEKQRGKRAFYGGGRRMDLGGAGVGEARRLSRKGSLHFWM